MGNWEGAKQFIKGNQMSKWADYGISAVRYNGGHTHIDKARIHLDNGDKIGVPSECSRQNIVDYIKRGTSFVTIFINANGAFEKGQPVNIIRVNGIEYIKTESNNKAVDNLENLPEF